MAARSRLPDLVRLLDGLDDALYVVDAERRIVFVNEACAKLTGCTAEELVGRTTHYRTAEHDADPVAAAADALCPPPAAFGGDRASAEIVFIDGSSRRAEYISLGISADGAALVVGWMPSPETLAKFDVEDRRRTDEAQRLHAMAARIRREGVARYTPERVLGVSPAIERIRRQIAVAAATTAAVAIVGPAGVGKARIARTIHVVRSQQGSSGALVTLDGPTLDAESLQAAIRNLARPAADGSRRVGDLVIQDIDRMPVDAQRELAGFLRLIDLPTRLIVTSRESLVAAAAAGRFRADLAGKLTTLEIDVPPLAARVEDIPVLAQFFAEEANVGRAHQLGGFTTDALDRLAAYAWPGNVAELADVVKQAAVKAEGMLVTSADLPRRLDHAADAARYTPRAEESIVLDDFLSEIEAELLRRAMSRAKGNKTKAAQLLGITRPRLHRRLIQLGLEQEPVVFESADGEEPVREATHE